MNLLSKLSRDASGAKGITENKNLMFRVLLYFNKGAFPLDLVLHSLRILHNCLKLAPDFRTTCLDTHGFTLSSFDQCITDIVSIFHEAIKSNDWDNCQLSCQIASAISDVLPERSMDFQSFIIPLIDIVKEKTGPVRKTAAVCLAKLSRDEENGKIMRANHGTEVLVSLGGALAP